MSDTHDPWRAPTGAVALVFCLAGFWAGYAAADACSVAWWQDWGTTLTSPLGTLGGVLGMGLGFALVGSLRDALAFFRSAPQGGGERPSGAGVLARGVLTLSLLAAFGTVAVTGIVGLGWREVSPPGGGFRVMLPGEPIEEEEGEYTPQGRATGKRYLCRGNAPLQGCGVAFIDYPEGYVARNSPEAIFKGQRDALVPSEGELAGERPVALGGHPGTDLRVETHDGQVIACRMFLVGRRLYIVMAKYPRSDRPGDVDTFFDSFALTGG